MCCIFPYRKKMNNVCIFSHDQVTFLCYNCHRLQFNYNESAIWADTDIRLIATITAQSVRISIKFSEFIILLCNKGLGLICKIITGYTITSKLNTTDCAAKSAVPSKPGNQIYDYKIMYYNTYLIK